MADTRPRPQPRLPARPTGYTSVDASAEIVPPVAAEVEQRVAVTLDISDGFRFGCGFILAGVAFYFALVIVVVVAILVATILGIPLPFSGPTR
jgi:hypothetical protein